jgi:N6-adenosine-specific RNA methylase IME4
MPEKPVSEYCLNTPVIGAIPGDLERLRIKGGFGAILADPPWRFQTYSGPKVPARGAQPYRTMPGLQISQLAVGDLVAPDCVLFLWCTWPTLLDALAVIEAWGFEYKTCAFDWVKAHAGQIEMFRDDTDPLMGMGYWTRANSEPCLLATRGKPRRLSADVRQGIIAPRREHSRKPDGVHERIERLVSGPYLELFARQQRPGWSVWGNETDKFPIRPEQSRSEWDSMWSKPFAGTDAERHAKGEP